MTAAVSVALALGIAGCGTTPAGSVSGQTSPSLAASPDASSEVVKVPAGRIAYMRVDADKVERYFTVDTDGTNEHKLFETQHCACIGWDPTGTRLWTTTETEGFVRFTTMDPDGRTKVVYTPDIPTLNLAPGFGSADGRYLGLFGWDDSDESRLGLWVAKTDLTDLHQVAAAPEGTIAVEPIGMSHDGAHIYFLGDLGPNTDNQFHHAGNVYVVGSDGTGLRQLNPAGTKTEVTGTGVSVDGRHFAFTAWQAGKAAAQGNAMFIVDGADAGARRVTHWTVGMWGASWAPGSQWLGYSSDGDATGIISVMKPDGSGAKSITPSDTSVASFGPVWSPGGKHLLIRRGAFHENDLWIMDLDGRLVWQVTRQPSSYDVYDWAPAAAS